MGDEKFRVADAAALHGARPGGVRAGGGGGGPVRGGAVAAALVEAAAAAAAAAAARRRPVRTDGDLVRLGRHGGGERTTETVRVWVCWMIS